MTYREHFKKNYAGLLEGYDNDALVRIEQELRDIIDSEFFRDFVLAVEVRDLYELTRDECVRRLWLTVVSDAVARERMRE